MHFNLLSWMETYIILVLWNLLHVVWAPRSILQTECCCMDYYESIISIPINKMRHFSLLSRLYFSHLSKKNNGSKSILKHISNFKNPFALNRQIWDKMRPTQKTWRLYLARHWRRQEEVHELYKVQV